MTIHKLYMWSIAITSQFNIYIEINYGYVIHFKTPTCLFYFVWHFFKTSVGMGSMKDDYGGIQPCHYLGLTFYQKEIFNITLGGYFR